FLVDHLEEDTHWIRVSGPNARKIPVPIGPALPRRDRELNREKHARIMLILFKPWRHADDLRLANQTWSQAYEQFLLTCREYVTSCIDNMQILHECKDSRDA
ncbi:hypothetical protein C8R43DRAFT_825114, partial [Mycena crocata]